jgi:hypothetical protein
MRFPLGIGRSDFLLERFGHEPGQDFDGSRIAIRHILDLFHYLPVEHGLALWSQQFLRRGNQESHFGFKQFCNLPQEMQRRALSASLDIHHRRAADPKSLRQKALAQVRVLSRLTDLPSHSTIKLVEVRHQNGQYRFGPGMVNVGKRVSVANVVMSGDI